MVPNTHVRFDEFVAPAPDPWPLHAEVLTAPAEHVAGGPLEVRARVVPANPSPTVASDSVTLWLAPGGRSWFRPFPMTRDGAYEYRASIPSMEPGLYDYALSVKQDDATTTFPSGVPRAPTSWNYGRQETWRLAVVAPTAPLRLLDPGTDVERLSFSRVGDGWREGIFRVLPSTATGEPVIHLELPVNVGGISPEDYTMSLFVGDRVAARGESIARSSGVRLRARGVGPSQAVHVTLVENDGTSWSAPVTLEGDVWRDIEIPLRDFRIARGVKLPQGYPSNWNYWIEPAGGRGSVGDRIRLEEVERLQLSLQRVEGVVVEAGTYGVEVERVSLAF
jgi:hypothetical protein